MLKYYYWSNLKANKLLLSFFYVREMFVNLFLFDLSFKRSWPHIDLCQLSRIYFDPISFHRRFKLQYLWLNCTETNSFEYN